MSTVAPALDSANDPTIEVLLRLEITTYLVNDYLGPQQPPPIIAHDGSAKQNADHDDDDDFDDELSHFQSPPTLNKRWREMVAEWAYQVVDHFDMNRDTVAIAMNYLDRYLMMKTTATESMDSRQFQLVALACLYIAIKLNEYKRMLVVPGCSSSTVETILQMSSGRFTLEQLKDMELDVLARLGWHLNPPTAQVFVKYFVLRNASILSLPVSDQQEVMSVALYLVELSVLDYFFVSYRPSEIAMSAIRNAVDMVVPPAERHSIRQQLQPPLDDDACCSRLRFAHTQAQEDGNYQDDDAVIMTVARDEMSPVSVIENVTRM